MSKKTLPNLFEYNDFRRYLADYQAVRLAYDSRFTRSGLCRMLGQPNTRSYFVDVLNGKDVSDLFLERFVKVLELDQEEARYFRVLVHYNQAKNPDERELLFEQLYSLNRTPKSVVDRKAFAYYSEWHHGAIRALLDVIDFDGDFAALGRRLTPAITTKKVRQSIHLLESLGLIARNRQGIWKPVDKAVTTESYSKDELIRRYQSKCIDLARSTLSHPPSAKAQNISTSTISVSAEGYRRIEKRLQKFKNEVRSIVHKDEKAPDRVYQLNIQLFSLTK